MARLKFEKARAPTKLGFTGLNVFPVDLELVVARGLQRYPLLARFVGKMRFANLGIFRP